MIGHLLGGARFILHAEEDFFAVEEVEEEPFDGEESCGEDEGFCDWVFECFGEAGEEPLIGGVEVEVDLGEVNGDGVHADWDEDEAEPAEFVDIEDGVEER